MGNPLYAVRETGLCPACRFPRDSTYHFRLHVPRDRWPASMGKSAPRVEHGPYERAVAFSEYEAVIDALDAVIEANDADTCEACGLRGGGDDCPHIDVFAAVSDVNDRHVVYASSELPEDGATTTTAYAVVSYGPNHPNSAIVAAVSGEASAPGFRTFPDAADAEVPPSPEAAPTCVCGRVAASNAGLAAHQRHCAQFKAVTA